MDMDDHWQFFADRGGTFTDIVGRAPNGTIHALKLPSIVPGRYEDATVPGIRALLAQQGATGAPISEVRVGTTVATNALLERRGARTLLITHAGLGDALAIGTQERPHLFRRYIELSEPLYERVIESTARISADGTELAPVDEYHLSAALAQALRDGFDSVAVIFLHSWQFPSHELQVAALAEAAGFTAVVLSHAVSPIQGYIPRGHTAAAEAYLAVLISRYVGRLVSDLEQLGSGIRVKLMQSHGGLAPATAFRGTNGILSGPAGGLVGMVRTGLAAGFPRLIGFDMGGTSTDVSLFDGHYPRRQELRVAGTRIAIPSLDVHTVAAGGGSILRYRDGRFSVGPDSAGAAPGPACYGRDGPLAITDCQIALGRLQADFLPSVFGPRGSDPLLADAARGGFAKLAAAVTAAGRPMTPEEVANGFLCVAVDTMANAIKQVSLRVGLDPADFALSSFGGAAGQVACRVADALGIRSILIHPMAGVLSALGIGLAETRALRRASLSVPLDEEGLMQATALAAELAKSAAADFGHESVSKIESLIEIRGHRSEFALSVPLTDCKNVRRIFAEQYRRRFGFAPDGDTCLIIAAVITECIGSEPSHPPSARTAEHRSRSETTECWFDGHWQETRIYRRADLAAGECISGPALIVEKTATTVVEPHWQARHDVQGLLLLECNGPPRLKPTVDPTLADPILLEVFNGLYTHIAEQMGAVLQQSASSVNIRERLDYSCAIFDADGRLVANAPHMPVHLGSMGASVRAVMARNLDRAESGDAYLVNSPYAGGTHLPDLTVVSPVFISGQSKAAFWVASRAHHADIGGITPGSMPPFSRSIDEEGALFDGERIVHGDRFDRDGVVMRLTKGSFPARNVPQNLADLTAQLAANARGGEELTHLTHRYGQRVVDAYLEHVQKNAEVRVRGALRALPIAGRGAITNCREMDSGERICVEIRIDAESGDICVDFTGTSAQSPTNFNAPKAVCTAAVLYVLRSLVDDEIPLNEGCLAPLELRIPSGSLLDPQPPAAVVAGNVETSQIIVDLLYGAFGVLADAQGTMNNLTFGDETCQYYETIAGGSGAGENFDGADGVQTHMTNSRLTDPEILETRLPVRLERFAYRRGSGGKGLHRGGDGLIRRLRFLRPLEVAILSNRRRVAPSGIAGGHSGAVGINRLVRANGEILELGSTAAVHVEPGDSVEIETPGGGGYGAPTP